MHDVSDALIPPHDPYLGAPIGDDDHACFLDALAALHATFWESQLAINPAPGLCRPEHRYRAFSSGTGESEAGSPDVYPQIIREGWSLLPSLIDADVASRVMDLANEPGPLAAALARYPQTIVHGDPRPPNIGQVKNGARRTVLIDWHFVGPGVPGLDLTWYLYTTGPGRTLNRESIIAIYRERLERRLGARFDERWWQPQLELSLLGQFTRCAQDMAWATVHHDRASVHAWARETLDWWSERARQAASLL
jgi:hypothetical protein